MEFLEAMPVTFKEITPNYSLPEKWKEIILNTGGTHSTLQDIKLPQKAGGYWYKDSKKVYTRNRFIYWQTTSDAIELSEASLDINLSSANLRCKVAPGTPPLSSITVYERSATRDVVILAATVSSVHRLIFPHPGTLDKKSTFGSLSSSSPSIFHDTSSVNNPNNYFILNQYSNATTGVAHTCASLLRDNSEAVFALAFGHGGEGGLLLVKLPMTGTAVTTVLKRESTVPRFLSGITGALRGKSSTDGVETYGVVLTSGLAVAICGDTCLRAWPLDEGGAPIAVSAPLSQTLVRPKPPPHGHMLQRTIGSDGSVILVAYLSFPNECEFVVMKMHDGGSGGVRFSHISRIFGPQLDLLDYAIGYGDGSNVIWALWSQPDGDTIITSVFVGAEAWWRAVAGREAAAALPVLGSHQQYRDRMLAPGLFPPAVIRKALVIYNRTWGSNDTGGEADLGDAATHAVQARLRHLTARTASPDHAHLMHKCWADLYSWCMQYMETLQKPLGLMVSKQESDVECGWWCAVVRRAGISLICELEPLERMMLSPDVLMPDGSGSETGELSADAVRIVVAGARWERAAAGAAAELERRLFACAAPQHRLLPRLLHLLLAPNPTQSQDNPAPTLTPQQIDDLTSILEPIKDLQSAVLELNDALRLDVPEIDTTKNDEEDTGEYDGLLASDLGVAIVTEAIRQMAEMRSRVVRGALCALGAWRGAGGVPGAGHCAVHWQAYRALLWLRAATLQPQAAGSSEAFRLKLSALGAEAGGAEIGGASRGGAVWAYVRAAGGRRARAHLHAARAPTTWHQALPLLAYHLAHQLWAVSGGFEFSWWLASIEQPRLVQNYVNMLEPWCEWNACSRQFILGLALLDLDDAENAYTAFCKAAKGVSTEPFLRQLVAAPDARLTQHQALVLYYMKVIKLFEIHDAGACVVRLAETAISIADKDDPNLAMFQWVVFKWHLQGGRTGRALSAAAANPAPHARHAAAATLLTTLASRRELGALVACSALAGDAERAAAARAKLHDAHAHNPYYDFLYALHVSRHHYRKAAAVMYERAARCYAERSAGAAAVRRRCLGAALTCLRLAQPDHAFLARPAAQGKHLQVTVVAAAVMYERAARCYAERSAGAAAVRRRCLGAALTCLRLAQPDHAFLARPAAQGKHLQVTVVAAAVMYERAARCYAERSAGAAAVRRRCLGAALTCLRLAQPDHAFLARPAAQGKHLQVTVVAAAVMYERAARCYAERSAGAAAVRRRCLGAALTCLRLAQPDHAFLARPAAQGKHLQVTVVAAAVMYERAARCYAERSAGAAAVRRRCLGAALTCLRLAQPDHAFLARPAAQGKHLQVTVVAAAVMYERAARCYAERSAGAAAVRRRCLGAALTCLRLAQPDHAFLARPAAQGKHLQVIGPEELAAELREEDPDSLDPVQQALLKGDNIDFDALYPKLKDADPETLLAVLKRAISTGQFLPHWFLQRYMEADGAGCVRALLSGGRAAEAGVLCCSALRRALHVLLPHSPAAPRCAPLALADLLLAELAHHTADPYIQQVYNDLDDVVKEYTKVVIRISDDMKLARLEHAVN